MIPVKEAKDIIQSKIQHLDVEVLSLKNSAGRVIAENIQATFPMPRFDNSAMDGFAVRAEDTKSASQSNPVTLKMVSVSSAGSPSNIILKPGECAQCMTGATIPNGADAIVMVEDSSGYSDQDSVRIFLEAQPGKHIRKKGEEIKERELLISKGTRISPSEMGTCAMFGQGKVTVSRKPKIAIFGTGNELVEPGNELGPGQIYNSNLYVFADLAKKAGAEVVIQDVIKDSKESLRSFLSKALGTCDVIISSGGVSMGRFDYVRDIFIELDVQEHFWKVAQKPGKPLFFGTVKNTLIFGLPGNPVSSYLGFMEWVWPVIETMTGRVKRQTSIGILKEPFPREKVKYRFLFGQAWLEDGKLVCKPSKKVGSHMLSSSLGANCILASQPGETLLQAGEKIKVNILPWKSL